MYLGELELAAADLGYGITYIDKESVTLAPLDVLYSGVRGQRAVISISTLGEPLQPATLARVLVPLGKRATRG